MEDATSEADFDRTSWHDNIVYGVRFAVGDPMRGEWHSDLALDIDHIVEWVCRDDGSATFRVAPATLTFHNVTDVRIAVDFGDSGHRTGLNELSIAAITRATVADQKICLDRPYYRWRIELNLPQGGEISFGASGYSQHCRTAPVAVDQPRLAAADRDRGE